MKYNFAARMNIKPSATAIISALAAEKRGAGEVVHDMGIGEPVIKPADEIIDAVSSAMKNGQTSYPPVAGYQSLRQKTVDWHNEKFNTRYNSSNVIITPGGKMALYMMIQAMIDPGDEVIVITPYWVSYAPMVRLAGGVVKLVETNENENWKVSSDKLKEAITPRTKLVIFNNGGNPTGSTYSSQEIYKVLEVIKNKNVTIISDEVYSGLIFDGAQYVSAGSFHEFFDNVVIIESFSKGFALTGLRIGVVLAHEDIIKKLTTLQSQTTHSVATLSQVAAEAALDHAEKINSDILNTIEKRRNHFYLELERIFNIKKIKAPAALYAFLKTTEFHNKFGSDETLAKRLIEQANTAIVPGSAFGAQGYIRLSFGIPEEQITSGLEAISKLQK